MDFVTSIVTQSPYVYCLVYRVCCKVDEIGDVRVKHHCSSVCPSLVTVDPCPAIRTSWNVSGECSPLACRPRDVFGNRLSFTFIFTFTCLLTARVVGAPQMISQPVSCIFLCSPLPSVTWRTPGLSIPWYGLPTSSSVCLVFFPSFTVPCKMV